MKRETWGNLIPDSPFKSVFPDLKVPLVSIFPIIPGEQGNPPCYVVEGKKLTPNQVDALALLLAERDPNTKGYDLDELKQYVLEGLPLKTEWFCGVGTSDPAIFGVLR